MNPRLATRGPDYVHVNERYPGMTLEQAYRQADLDKKKQYRERNRDRLLQAERDYFKIPENRIKLRAKLKARRAVKRGQIKKQSCEVCDDPNTERHHDDYSKPYEVRWLCKKHHVEADQARRLSES
jgi:hypothetical protein